MPFNLLLSPLFRSLLLAGVIAGGLGWAYVAVRGSGVDECERDHAVADAAAAEEQHQLYLAAITNGEELSAELLKTQRRLDDTKREYITYASAIVGNCPGSVGVLSNAAASGSQITPPSSKPDAAPETISAADLAGNIAENYAIAHGNASQLSGLIRWVEEVIK